MTRGKGDLEKVVGGGEVAPQMSGMSGDKECSGRECLIVSKAWKISVVAISSFIVK